MTSILGLNAYHADAAAALVQDGRVLAAAEEERFNRIKHSAGFPIEAVRYCLRQGGLDLRDVDTIAIASKPIDHVREEILQILSGRPAYSRQIQKRLQAVAQFRDVRAVLAREFGLRKDDVPNVEEIPHHHAHVASAYFASGWEDAALLSIDGFGDFSSTLLGKGEGSRIEVLEEVLFPHSIGILYTMVTQFLGFSKYGDEGKVMGLAAFGQPVYKDRLKAIIKFKDQGLFELDPEYFTHPVYGVDMIWEDHVPRIEDIFSEKMIAVFGPPRHKYAEISIRDRDLAASLQAVLEDAVLHVIGRLRQLVPNATRLAYAGGVALNCVANVVIREKGGFKDLYIPPTPTDAGTAIGCALHVARTRGKTPAEAGKVEHSRLGPGYSNEEVEKALEASGLRYERSARIHEEVADLLAQGRVVGWFRGRGEFGPRALGGRSILADPRRVEMRDALNVRVKYREPFRPFAASVLEERQGELFTTGWPSPFMLYALPVKADARTKIPAVIHQDGTCRVQTVSSKVHADFHRLISAFAERTGVPVVLNTSFNENEPIVCSPADAIDCFVATKMDALALEDFLVRR
jgi:carbamoyltransferase